MEESFLATATNGAGDATMRRNAVLVAATANRLICFPCKQQRNVSEDEIAEGWWGEKEGRTIHSLNSLNSHSLNSLTLTMFLVVARWFVVEGGRRENEKPGAQHPQKKTALGLFVLGVANFPSAMISCLSCFA